MSDPFEIIPLDFEALRRTGQDLLLVDVREEWEWEYNRIPGAIHLPLGQLESRHAELRKPDRLIVCYCHAGLRSLQAAIWLRQEGHARVQSLAGGIDRWADDVDPDMPRY